MTSPAQTLLSADLYFYNEDTQTFQSIENPTPYITSYYYYEEATESYSPYTGPLYFTNDEYENPITAELEELSEPSTIEYESREQFYESILTAPAEEEEESSPSLYYYDTFTESLQSIPEVTPYITEYYSWNEETQSFAPYTAPVTYYNLYTYDVYTDSYEPTETPVLGESEYYYYDVPSNSFVAYEEPESVLESNFYETFNQEMSTIHGANVADTTPTLYYYNEMTNTYYELEPTPLVSSYYYYD